LYAGILKNEIETCDVVEEIKRKTKKVRTCNLNLASHGTLSYIYVYTNAFVMLRHPCAYDTIFATYF
jgi:hypothetical protein